LVSELTLFFGAPRFFRAAPRFSTTHRRYETTRGVLA
jgi:hypothetical protein